MDGTGPTGRGLLLHLRAPVRFSADHAQALACPSFQPRGPFDDDERLAFGGGRRPVGAPAAARVVESLMMHAHVRSSDREGAPPERGKRVDGCTASRTPLLAGG